jgi:hypothetical protein
MSPLEALDDAPLDQRLVLLAILDATRDRETPVNPAEVRSICTDHFGDADLPVVGGLSEADVTRALYTLEDRGLVEHVAPESTSPTGKGRPTYDLDAAPADVRAAIARQPDLEPLVADLED